jgi:tetratricopeptide (TPR) repeat protein
MRAGAGGQDSGRLRTGLGSWLLALLLALAPAGSGWAQAPEADVFVARAILAYDDKRFEDALAALRQALELAPDHVDALYYTGLTLFALGRTNEAIASFEQALSRQPDDDAILFQLGLAHLTRGDYDAAQRPLERAYAINPARDSLGYYVGLLRYRQRDYAGAVRAFREGVITSPEIQQLAHFYTGLALSGLGQRERVASELEEALRVQPASPLTGPAERLRQAVLAARERERRFRAELRVGGFYDDNVPAVPAHSNDPFIQDLRRSRRESTGELGALRLDYALLRRPSLETTLTYSFFATYNNDLPGFNLMSHLGGLTTTYRGTVAGLPVYLSLPYTYDYFTLGEDPFIQRHIVAPWASLAEGRYHLTTLQARYMNKDFFEKSDVLPEDNRDATNWMLGVNHLLRFQRDRHLLRVGYQWDVENATGRNFSYDGHRVLAGAQYTLPWAGVRLNYDFDVHLRGYRHPHSTLPADAPNTTRRSDTEYTHVVSVTVPLPRDLALVVQYQVSRARSNLDPFTYNRNVVFVYLVWTY